MTSARPGAFEALTLPSLPRERRSAMRRHATRLVQVEHDGEADFGHCHDISDTGMRLETKRPVALHDVIAIAFSPSQTLRGKVVWARENQCGIVFTQKIDSAALLRVAASNLPALTDQADHAHPLAIVDLAVLGNHDRNAHGFRAGLTVTIMLPSGQEERAVVQWTQDRMVGLLLLEYQPESGSGAG